MYCLKNVDRRHSKYDSTCACSSCKLSFQSNGGANFSKQGPTFCIIRAPWYFLNVHKVNPERISKACPKLFCSNFFVVAFVSSWANLKTNLGSYTPGNLQLQATVSSNISGFLARLQPLHLDHDYVGKGRSNVSKSTLFIQEAWQGPHVFEASCD